LLRVFEVTRIHIEERENKSKAVEELILQLRVASGFSDNMMVHKLEFVRAYTAPIRRLRPEFLQEILKHSVPVADNTVIAIERHPCC